jgi:hypothetical protein
MVMFMVIRALAGIHRRSIGARGPAARVNPALGAAYAAALQA